MVACCSKARAAAKIAATRKATRVAKANAAAGVIPKKSTAKKAAAKKTPAKKIKPCRICGKAK